jgi:hypothetical protein
MKTVLRLLAALGAFATVGAHALAPVTGSLGGGMGPFLALAGSGPCGACTLGGSFASISGGSVDSASVSTALVPLGTADPSTTFLAAGPDPGQPGTVHFASGVSYISFLWGSPDDYNSLVVDYGGLGTGSATFSATGVGLTIGGLNSNSRYVQFQAQPGYLITDLVFTSSVDAFETSNYSITPVPEPETYALLAAGLGVLGWVARRRRA